MRSSFQKPGAFLLALLLLFSTLSFTVEMHFCGKILVDVGLLHEAENCGMAAGQDLMSSFGCCKDVEVAVSGQDQLASAAHSDLPAPQYIPLFDQPFQNAGVPLVMTDSYRSVNHPDPPPEITKDRLIRFQVFRL